MGLISRVSSRTYRFEFANCKPTKMLGRSLVQSNRALSLTLSKKTSLAPRFRLGPVTLIGRIFYNHSLYPNGIIRFKSKACTYSKFEFSGNMLLMIAPVLGLANLYRLTTDGHFFPKFNQAGCGTWNNYYTHWKRYGIVPDLNDRSYGSWNYYPKQ